MIYIPKRNIRVNELFNEYKWIIDKICDILFTENYNDYCKKMARSFLNFIVKADRITWKQVIVLNKLNPKK